MCSKVSVAHTQDDPPDASIIKAIGAASKSNRNFALARREEDRPVYVPQKLLNT